MDMILADTALDDINIIAVAYLTDNIPQPDADIFRQNVVSIFGHPYQMHL
jgi:hypothetical protein